jgi:hypothetical protein
VGSSTSHNLAGFHASYRDSFTLLYFKITNINRKREKNLRATFNNRTGDILLAAALLIAYLNQSLKLNERLTYQRK